MTRRMPRPEEVSHEHIDATVMGYLKAEKDLEWTEVALVTLHPREEIRIVLRDDQPSDVGMTPNRRARDHQVAKDYP